METRFLIICFTAPENRRPDGIFRMAWNPVLRGGGCEIKKFERHGDGSIRKIVEELVYPESAQAVIIALDAETLLRRHRSWPTAVYIRSMSAVCTATRTATPL